ncbi:hypothetical protein [Erythrobacter sp.]|uniref:hypothetical protein n=1 Tax=Erythrobacter sp. TaxID=1042 RepID=UPI001425E35A|nr:hypothetical protein [Erythrobacter sp.]QIQ85493.1 MAG: hypothetical protein G9473_01445 [Erythrobacter sp.]
MTRPVFQLSDYPQVACGVPGEGSGRVFHVDPVRGSADGDGSRERPWRDLQGLVDRGLVGERRRHLSSGERLLAAVLHRPERVTSSPREAAVVRGGDVIRLAEGDYGALDLSYLANSRFVTIEAAPGAIARFASLRASGASHFILRRIEIAGDALAEGSGHLRLRL